MKDHVIRFKNLKAKFPNGASAIKCCYAPTGIHVSSTMTEIVKWASANILDEKIFLSLSRHLVNPACMTSVLTSRPNFNAR
jgi:hypothetical protein